MYKQFNRVGMGKRTVCVRVCVLVYVCARVCVCVRGRTGRGRPLSVTWPIY